MILISKCKVCGNPQMYSEQYDAAYCPNCNTWLEDKCDEAECEYCSNRPETPNAQSSNQ